MKIQNWIIALGIAAVVTFNLQAQTEAPKLFRVQKDGKVGFIDNTGKVVIPLTYWRNNGEFSEGLAAVETTNQGWQYIDETGQTKFVLGFDCFPAPFHDGMAAVVYSGPSFELSGYIDKEGHQVIKPQFTSADDFSEGFGLVQKPDVGDVFIDKTGQVVFPQYSPQPFQYFSEGLASVWIGPKFARGRLTGYIDRTGKLVIPCEYSYGEQCKEGVVMVGKDGVGMGLNTNGEVVIKGNFQQLRPFSEGLAQAKIDGKWGYIDHQGKVVIEPQYEFCSWFSESLAGVRVNGKWGFIDKTGKMVIEPNFKFVNLRSVEFQGGLASVVEGTKTGYIDKTGAWVWTPSE